MTDHSQISAARQTGWLLLVAISIWVLCAGPAYWLRGSLALEGLTYAGILCLVPGLVVIYVTSRFPGGGSAGTGVMLGTGLRLAFVLIGMVMIQNLHPDLGHYEFQLWLIINYLAFLAVETLIVVKSTESQES